MFKQLNKGTNIIIIVVFALACLSFIINAIIGIFKKPELLNTDDITQYIITDNVVDENGNITKASNIVKDYNTFYTLQDATENFIQYIVDQKFSQTYSVLSDEIKSKYSKSEYEDKIKVVYDKNFSVTYSDENIKNGQDNGINNFNNSNNLVNLYKISENEYICETKNVHSKIFKLGIRLENNNTYKVFYIDF